MGVKPRTGSKIITLFGSYRPKPGSKEYLLACRTGEALARAGFLLCNGGFGGTMEASAKGAKEAGGETIGITFSGKNLKANPYIDRVEKKRSLLERLERLVTIADGYLVFKGGTGTLLEVSLVLEYTHKKFMPLKPMVFLGNFWKATVKKARQESGTDPQFHFTKEADRMKQMIRFVSTPEAAARAFREILESDGS
ncbi:MAG: LOG family protein [Candidatus Omnitrophica bacterium]|nr:LOG family protein [Candidatus Omnitrophota bacterium]